MSCLDRLRALDSALTLLEREYDGHLSETDIKEHIHTLIPTKSYTFSMILEDFVETSSLSTLNVIQEALQLRPLSTGEDPETSKMSVLKIFNLFHRRLIGEIGSKGLASFLLIVTKAVKVSDRSGVNIKGDKNQSHFRLAGAIEEGEVNHSQLVTAISNLQAALYSPTPCSTDSIKQIVHGIVDNISPSLVEADDLLDSTVRLESAPYILVDPHTKTVDVDTAVIILIQCVFLIEAAQDKDLRSLSKQVISLLKKTTIGRRLSKYLHVLNSSDLNWRKWKKADSGKDLSMPALSIDPSRKSILTDSLTGPLSYALPTRTLTDVGDSQESPDLVMIAESDWYKRRKELFHDDESFN